MKPQQISLNVLPTHFHERTSQANRLNCWHSWQGYTTSDAYTDAELEYFAVRNATGVFDLCPMTKYRITGDDALAYLNRLMTRDIAKLKRGRVAYVVWCNDAGKVIDDGTLFYLENGDYRLCAQERHIEWLTAAAIGFDVSISDETDAVAALAVQGPTSCAILKQLGLADIEQLRPFALRTFELGTTSVCVSRTGFTGDLGYELWIDPADAIAVWDALFAAGRLHGIVPIGSVALNMARIEAGFIQAGADFLPADNIVRPGRARSPFELALGWLVDFKKGHFSGRDALLKESETGGRWQLVKLLVEGNKPAHAAYLFAGKSRQVGFVTSAVWSPVAKQNIALATVAYPHGDGDGELNAEIYYQREMHWSRVMARCERVTAPFWDPPRRRATPPADF